MKAPCPAAPWSSWVARSSTAARGLPAAAGRSLRRHPAVAAAPAAWISLLEAGPSPKGPRPRPAHVKARATPARRGPRRGGPLVAPAAARAAAAADPPLAGPAPPARSRANRPLRAPAAPAAAATAEDLVSSHSTTEVVRCGIRSRRPWAVGPSRRLPCAPVPRFGRPEQMPRRSRREGAEILLPGARRPSPFATASVAVVPVVVVAVARGLAGVAGPVPKRPAAPKRSR
mmetsp:Transcript_41136/g.132339  ORF Transcript_41136/g.132339 Transcript_41136/m.132339 type:complete len:230 (-) Transcript_41136:5118-5807(-)